MSSTELYKYDIPSIGAKGVYALLAPFTLAAGEIYECIGVRTISDYLANSEIPLESVYLSAGLTEDNYLDAAKVNMQIVTLRNDKGYAIYVPANYISKYPIQDGVDYRSLVIQAFLPPMPVLQDITAVENEISQLIQQRLGVTAQVSKVATSAVKAISVTSHEALQGARRVIIDGNTTVYATIALLQRTVDEQRTRIQVLEQYIKDNN